MQKAKECFISNALLVCLYLENKTCRKHCKVFSLSAVRVQMYFKYRIKHRESEKILLQSKEMLKSLHLHHEYNPQLQCWPITKYLLQYRQESPS